MAGIETSSCFHCMMKCSQTGEGILAVQVGALFEAATRRYGLDGPWPKLSTEYFRRPAGAQRLLL